MNEHANLAAALVAALADLTVVDKGREAKAGAYSYSYADIADVVKLTRRPLAEHGLVALTPVHAHGDELACTVTLLHSSGERLDFGPFTFPHGKDAQSTGSWVTYIRRYALVAALGMAAGDDDDGASAQPRQRAPKAQEQPQSPPPGKPKAQVKGELVAYLTGKVPEGTEKDHAAQVWTDAEVKVIDGKWVAPDEVSVLMATAKDHAENLAAMA